MPNFYSPEGNFEVWEKKPKGYFTVEEWQAAHPIPTPPPLTEDELAVQVRCKRDKLLQFTDKYLVSDFPLSADKLESVKEYRMALRDIPSQKTFPRKVVWPDFPLA